MRNYWNLGVLIAGLLGTCAAFAYVFGIWSFGYPPRWEIDVKRVPMPELLQLPFLQINGRYRFYIAPAFDQFTLITIDVRPDGGSLKAEQFNASYYDGNPIWRYNKKLSISDVQYFEQSLYAIGAFDKDAGYQPTMLDGTTVGFDARVADKYFGYESDHGGEEITAIQQLFEQVCGSRCTTSPFKL